jgi:hypothetical protein
MQEAAGLSENAVCILSIINKERLGNTAKGIMAGQGEGKIPILVSGYSGIG